MKKFFYLKNKPEEQQPLSDTSNQESKIRIELEQLEKQLAENKESSDDLTKKHNYLLLKSEWLKHNKGKLLLPGRFDEYDCILPIGATCHVSMLLDYFKLRSFSSPFDWTGGSEPEGWSQKPGIYRNSRFHEKTQGIFNNFKDFLNPKYLKYVSKAISPQKTPHNVINIKTNLRYIHEFPGNQDILQYMPEFIEKTNRRARHLYEAINSSKKILIVWIASIWNQCTVLEQNVSDKDIKWAIKHLNKKYPEKIFDFVFFEPDGSKGKFEFEKITVVPGAYRIKSNHFFNDLEYDVVHRTPDDNHRHVHVISEMLDNIHLSKDAFSLPEKEKTA